MLSNSATSPKTYWTRRAKNWASWANRHGCHETGLTTTSDLRNNTTSRVDKRWSQESIQWLSCTYHKYLNYLNKRYHMLPCFKQNNLYITEIVIWVILKVIWRNSLGEICWGRNILILCISNMMHTCKDYACFIFICITIITCFFKVFKCIFIYIQVHSSSGWYSQSNNSRIMISQFLARSPQLPIFAMLYCTSIASRMRIHAIFVLS